MHMVEIVQCIDLSTIRRSYRRWRSPPLWIAAIASFAVSWMLLPTPDLRAQQISLEPIARLTSDQLKELAVVADVAADRQGRVFILDPTAPGIFVADARLRPIGYFGSRGSGPGEFREPVAIAMLADGRVAVLDRALGRITVFTVQDGGRSLLPQRTVSLNMSSEAMCILPGDQFLIYGLNAGKRLHVVDMDGQQIRSFAPPDAKLSPMALNLLTRGRIACERQRDEVLVSSKFLPYVEAFRTSTGERLWVDLLEPFRGISVLDGRGAVTISSGPAGFSVISSLFSLGDYRVFQTVYESRIDGAVADTIGTYVYSIRAQAWLPPEFDLPLIFRTNGDVALSVEGRDQLKMEFKLNRLLMIGDDADRMRPRIRRD